jgi:hypothetical protein
MRPGQFWANKNTRERGFVIEILGMGEREWSVHAIVWGTRNQRIPAAIPGSELWLENDQFALGAGSPLMVNMEEDFKDGNYPQLLETTKDRHHYRRGAPCNSCTVTATSWRGLKAPLPRIPTQVSFEGFETWIRDATAIYTDGSFMREGSFMQRARGEAKITASGAIVKRNTVGLYAGIAIEDGTAQHTSAFSTELLSLTLASEMRRRANRPLLPIWSDCAAAISTLTSGKPLSYHKCEQVIEKHLPHDNIWKVQAHPERREKIRANWSSEEHGIYKADLVASRHHAKFERETLSRLDRIMDTEIIEVITADNKYTWLNARGAPWISDHADAIAEKELEEYKNSRDEYRRKAGREPKWATTQGHIAAAYLKKSKSMSKRAAACRVIWDKNWNGYNKGKAGGDTACRLCPSPMEDQDHIIRKCQNREIKRIRKETLEKFNAGLEALRIDLPKLGRIIERYKEMALDHRDGAMLWIGQMPQSLANTIGLDVPISDGEWSRCIRATTPLFEGTMAIYAERNAIIKEMDREAGVTNPKRSQRRKEEDDAAAEERRKTIEARNTGNRRITEFFPRVGGNKRKSEKEESKEESKEAAVTDQREVRGENEPKGKEAGG